MLGRVLSLDGVNHDVVIEGGSGLVYDWCLLGHWASRARAFNYPVLLRCTLRRVGLGLVVSEVNVLCYLLRTWRIHFA